MASLAVPAIAHSAKLAKSGLINPGSRMQTLTAKDAKYGFGRLIDLARAEPVAVAKHGRTVVVVLAIEEYERLKAIESERSAKAPRSGEKI
jgi:prevent-host-death family protein